VPYTQTQIDELKARIAAFAGIKGTAFADQSTTFDLGEARKLLADMEREVSNTVGGSRTRYAATSKGC
jgi:hypothetical protein